MSTVVQHYQTEFERVSASLPWPDSEKWLAWRRAGWEYFASQGFPTTRHEEWKYTSLVALEKLLPSCALPAPSSLSWSELQDRVVLPDARYRLVFVDGRYDSSLSRLDGLPKGLQFGPLSSQSALESLKLQALLDRLQKRTPFTALGTAFMTDGAWMHAGPDVILAEPLLVVYVSTQGQRATHLVNAFEMAMGANVTMVEHHLGLTDQPYFVNAVTGVTLDASARLTHVKVQREGSRSYHIGALQVLQKRDSRLDSHAFALSGALGRNDIEAVLGEPGARVSLNGLYRASGREHQDLHTVIRHDSPDCVSDERFKGVLDESGRAVFNGRIVVAKDAQHTVSQQSNHNLLLSDQAEVDTKPQLEIFADDVKCSHGATVGQLDEEQWFYLRSRGISADHARTILIEAFALDILGEVESPGLCAALDRQLRGAGNA